MRCFSLAARHGIAQARSPIVFCGLRAATIRRRATTRW
jgi:hypothetical protein